MDAPHSPKGVLRANCTARDSPGGKSLFPCFHASVCADATVPQCGGRIIENVFSVEDLLSRPAHTGSYIGHAILSTLFLPLPQRSQLPYVCDLEFGVDPPW